MPNAPSLHSDTSRSVGSRPADGATPDPDLAEYVDHVGKDPSQLIFEDELTGIGNRRSFLRYLENEVPWDAAEGFRLSLLVVDLDHFKEINDAYGHEVGDTLLTWIATLLRESGGESGIPIRYGGDEFVLLLPGADRAEALRVANSLMQRTRDQRFRIHGANEIFQVGLSIGIASAPEDARNGRDLFHAGDTALYHAKKSGRGQIASAAEIDLAKVFSRTALHRLKAIGICGRDEELAAVSGSLDRLIEGRSGFITVEGAPGMGKTAFLNTIARNLANETTIRVVKVAGVQQEAFRPYYLATSILVEFYKRKEVDGAPDLQDMTREELAGLAHVLPQWGDGEPHEPDPDGTGARAAIFAALMRYMPKLADSQPLVVLIDDLQFCDQATLYLLGALVKSNDLDILVCGTHTESVHFDDDGNPPPLDSFLEKHRQALDVDGLTLRALQPDAIVDHLEGVFPNLKTPEGFVHDLERITLGNPLFITEIIRKLVREQKATLVGREWVIEPLPDGYLPQSLEEIVGEMIAALDQESRALLEQASTLGEDVSVSVLTGASEADESKVLEFLDRAEGLGLVALDFQVNDEIMRFLGKQVMEISYGSIDHERRKQLHERVAKYQEGLYENRLFPAASLLAYHFKRSANEEKARRYQSMQAEYGHAVFGAGDVAGYIAELEAGGLDLGEPLEEEALQLVPDVLRGLLTTVRSMQLYPANSDAVAGPELNVKRALEEILEETDRLTLAYSEEGALRVNGEELDFGAPAGVATSFVDLLRRSQLQGMSFVGYVEMAELLDVLGALAALTPGDIDRAFWERYSAEHGLRSIELRQTTYSRATRADDPAESPSAVGVARDVEEDLEADDVAAIPDILRAFGKTASNVKLYPLQSVSASRCLKGFRESLVPVLARRRVLSLARTGSTLLANGSVVNTAEYETLAESFLKLIESLGVHSITFSTRMTEREAETFFGAIRELPKSGADPEFWIRFAAEEGLSGISVNHEAYSLVTAPGGPGTASIGTSHGANIVGGPFVDANEVSMAPAEGAASLPASGFAPADHPPADHPPVARPQEDSGETLQELGKELLVDGEDELFEELLQKALADFRERDAVARAGILGALRDLFDSLIHGLQYRFAALAGNFVVEALVGEQRADVLAQGASLIHAMSTAALQHSDSRTAARLYEALAAQSAASTAGAGADDPELLEILAREPDDVAAKILRSDLSSGDPSRQADAALALTGLGEAGIPVIIDIIKRERDLRTRQTAASILADMGPTAADHIKRALTLEVIVEQRFHILEVIETVTMDLQEELALCLGDINPKIRRAAFRLAERLQNDDLAEVLDALARDEDPAVAKGALRSLAGLGNDQAVRIVTSVLDSTKEPEVAVACCQALGQIGDPSAVGALSRVLSRKKLSLFGFVWSDQVRATAAMVLNKMADRSAGVALRQFVDDRDPRIRRVARSAAVRA